MRNAAISPISHTNTPERVIGRLAARQFGAVSREQALAAGLTPSVLRHRVDCGKWALFRPGVYVLAGAPPSWEQNLMGAQLWAGPEAVISHRSAGALFHLDAVAEGCVELLTTGSRSQAPPGIIMHRTKLLAPADFGHLGPFRVTGIVRTLMDLGAVLEPARVEAAMESALRRDPDLFPRLIARLAEFDTRGRGGARVLGEILAGREAGAAPSEGLFETLLERALKDGGVLLPVRQYEVKEDGTFVARVDFAYPEHHLALEPDGFRWHWGRRRWRNGLRRGNALTLLGWRVLHITWEDLDERPAVVVEAVRRALGS